MLQFEWPWVFSALPLPALIYFLLPRAKKEESSLLVPFYQRVESALHVQAHTMANRNVFKLALLSLIWLMMVIATARPQWIGEAINLPTSGRDLLVAVDISGSMETPDMVVENQQLARIVVVKYVVGEFLKRRESDRLGLILFGTNAYLQAPLTFDRQTVNKLLQETQLGFAGEQTAIGDAIGLGIKRLKDRPESQRVLILLTDGHNTAGEVLPRQAADLAKQAGVKIYTIGVGAEEMTVNRGIFGGFSQRVNPSKDLDENTLNYIAETTGGLYFRARNPEELAQIYAELDKLEPIEQEAETFRPIEALFYWPLGMSLALSLFLLILNLLPLNLLASKLKPSGLSSSNG